MANFTESIVEEATLAWLEALGHSVLNGPDIAVGVSAASNSAKPDSRCIRGESGSFGKTGHIEICVTGYRGFCVIFSIIMSPRRHA